jgi:hypothetical protein
MVNKNSRDFTGKNRKFTGTKGIVTPKGTTGERVGSESGELRFNTTTELMEYYDGTTWKPIDAPPTISSVTTNDSVGTNTILRADGSSLFTITITGGNFSLNPTVRFIGSTGTEYTPGNITRVSASSITCTTLITMGTTDDPYDVKVTNTSGLSATLDDAFSYNAAPVFVTASGQLGTVYNTQVISGTTLNASATDAESNTITYSIISGSLPGSGLTLSSSTGYITGTLSGTPSLGNYPFVVRAETTEGNAERQFSIQVTAIPFVAATGGTILTSGDFKTHVFTSPGTFTVTTAGAPTGSNSVEYLVVAGGGGGAAGNDNSTGTQGGAGAGGYRQNFPSPATGGLPVSAQSYPISVGGGGNAGIGPNGSPTNSGTPGSTSTFSNITSAGGGAGQGDTAGPIYSPGTAGAQGNPGGSGGGGSGNLAPSPGGNGNTPPVSPPQGNPGGTGSESARAGGGGGAGQAGGTVPASNPTSGKGGDGSPMSPTFFGPTAPSYGTPGPAPGRYFAGGGSGGRGGTCSSGGGGAGGGGTGSADGGATADSGDTNTGGGGAASGSGAGSVGGAGGSGIVVIRYKFQ